MCSIALWFTSETTDRLLSDVPTDPSLFPSGLPLSGELRLATEDSSGAVPKRDDPVQPTDETPSTTPSASNDQQCTTAASANSTSLSVPEPHHHRISIHSNLSSVWRHHQQRESTSDGVHVPGYFSSRAGTTLSSLPCELLDHIVDLLHDSQISLRNCCLVSKSWIPRTRTHLFAEVHFNTASSMQSWKETFPDPSTSPARYAKALFICSPQIVTATCAEAGCWIGGFPRVVRFVIDGQEQFVNGWANTFALLHGISPVLRSLRVNHVGFPAPQLLSLILSFPLLEDLSITDCLGSYLPTTLGGSASGPSASAQPSSLSAFIGSLDLDIRGGMEPIAHRLLALSGGMYCRKLTLKFTYNRIRHLRLHKSDLVLFLVDLGSASFNLSEATKLRDVTFRIATLRVEWITLALRDITSKHRDLRQISIDAGHYFSRAYRTSADDPRQYVGDKFFGQWLDLDRILVHLWESLSIHTNVKWTGEGGEWLGRYIAAVLPEMTKRGMVTIKRVL